MDYLKFNLKIVESVRYGKYNLVYVLGIFVLCKMNNRRYGGSKKVERSKGLDDKF